MVTEIFRFICASRGPRADPYPDGSKGTKIRPEVKMLFGALHFQHDPAHRKSRGATQREPLPLRLRDLAFVASFFFVAPPPQSRPPRPCPADAPLDARSAPGSPHSGQWGKAFPPRR